MSQLSQLKQQINSIGNDAKSTAQGLSGFKSKFSQSVGQVSATIGGSAQQVDQKMIQTLQAAEKQVDAAIAALQQAASAASSYASSL
jgi:ABC-type transporter Mla subunit MlaD